MRDLMMDRLESELDRHLVALADEYAPNRDPYGTASGALSVAKKYRSAHPYTSRSPQTAQKVQAALALPVKPPSTEQSN